MTLRRKIAQALVDTARKFDSGITVNTIMSGGYRFEGEQYDYANNKQNIIDNTQGWFHVMADRVATAAMQADYSVFTWARGGEKKELMTDLMYDIIDNPVGMSRSELIYSTVYDKRTLGNAFWYMPSNRYGLPAEIRYMHPSEGTMVPVKDGTGSVVSYRWKYGGKERPFEANEIIHFKYRSNHSSVFGKAPSMYFQDVFDFDRKIKELANATMDNGAQLGTIFLFSGMLKPEVKSEFATRLGDKHTGPRNANRSYIIENAGQGNDVKTISGGTKEVDYLNAMREMRDQAAMANGVPKALIPSSDQTNRATADADVYVFARFTLEPELKKLADEINYGLVRQYGKDKFIEFENVVPSDEKLDAEVRDILIRSGVPANELNRRDGLEEVEGGDVSMLPTNLAPVSRIIDGSVKQNVTIKQG